MHGENREKQTKWSVGRFLPSFFFGVVFLLFFFWTPLVGLLLLALALWRCCLVASGSG
jgi:hypothetical protein